MQKVGILYICTGKYSIFWKDFFLTCEKYFLPGIAKQYFVFTDAAEIYGESNENVNKIFQEKLQFPGDTLMRFDMFNRSKHKLEKMDHLFFFNANIRFLKSILPDEMFPTDEENGLIGYLHSGFYDKKPEEFIFERNPVSTAYIPVGEGTHYYQGCVIGGKTKPFMEMSRLLDIEIRKDLEKDFIAIWWDESHLNRYLLNKKVKILHPGYAYPELAKLPFEKKAIMLDKSRRGGVAFLRGQEKVTLMNRLKFFVKRILIR